MDNNCHDERRQQTVRDKGLNGIDYIEVIDDSDPRKLCVRLFGKAPEKIDKANVRIVGGERIRNIEVIEAQIIQSPDLELDDCLQVTVKQPGDFSTYALYLVDVDNGKPTDKPLSGFDARYAQAKFSFRANCPTDLDCATETPCPPVEYAEPEVNYLAKDYASFRQLILDRLSLIMPDWQERHVPDIGITLVELLAYVGDYLNYYQDAVATEAYLETARQRISVRRHARLVDYTLSEGCNARAWLCLWTDRDLTFNAKDIYFITGCDELTAGDKHALNANALEDIPASHYEVFEPMTTTPIQIYAAHSEIHFYTWGDKDCCLPRGTTRATLIDDCLEDVHSRQCSLQLKEGDTLIFEEVIGPHTGNPDDADPTHRHAVRLTGVKQSEDALYNQPIIEIEWAVEDALPFSLCLSTLLAAPECRLLENISVARGNVILVDHGRTVHEDQFAQVPLKEKLGECECNTVEVIYLPGKFQPVLNYAPLTFSQPLLPDTPASACLTQNTHETLPQILDLVGLPSKCPDPQTAQYVQEVIEGIDVHDAQWKWFPKRDLLDCAAQDQCYVAEIDNDGRTHLRFGDGELGRMPDACSIFSATYRVGNGPMGNVGAETISYLILRNMTLSGVTLRPRNPMPAQGGTPPESLAHAKLYAPHMFRTALKRAIIADDYSRLAAQYYKVQRAKTTLEWTGTSYVGRVAIDPYGSEGADSDLLDSVEDYLRAYQRMGHDIEIVSAVYVPLVIKMTVCVLPQYLRGHVEAALRDVFSNRVLPDGQRGVFHPDNLTFGEGIYVSKLVAAAQGVPGVQNASVTMLERLYKGPNHELDHGVLRLGSMEIAQLDNDPNFPEHGSLTLRLEGGR